MPILLKDENATTKLEDARDAKQGQHHRPDLERSQVQVTVTKYERQGKTENNPCFDVVSCRAAFQCYCPQNIRQGWHSAK